MVSIFFTIWFACGVWAAFKLIWKPEDWYRTVEWAWKDVPKDEVYTAAMERPVSGVILIVAAVLMSLSGIISAICVFEKEKYHADK